MNHGDTLLLGERDDALHIQISPYRTLLGVEWIGLVGLETVDRETVLLGEDRDRAQAKLVGGAENADRDFAAVRGHQFSGAGGDFGHRAGFLKCSPHRREEKF